MRLTIILAACGLMLSPPAPAAAEDGEIEAAFQTLQRAIADRDLLALERLVDPGFEMLHGGGQVEGRETWLRLVRDGSLSRQRAEATEYDVQTRIIDDFGYRSSIVRFRNRRLNEDLWVRGTAMFVRRNGNWVQVRHQSSLLHDGEIADAERLQDYVGEYDIPGRAGFRIEAEPGFLRFILPTGAVVPLVPAGGDTFGAGATSRIVFARDASGRVTGASRSGLRSTWWTATRRGTTPRP